MSKKKSGRRQSGNPARRAEQSQPKPIDFDAVRAERQRILGDLPPVRIGGKDYTLSPTLPLAVTEFFAESARTNEKQETAVLIGDMQKLLALLFGEDQWAEIRKVIDITEVVPLFNTVFAAYGQSVGESSASGES